MFQKSRKCVISRLTLPTFPEIMNQNISLLQEVLCADEHSELSLRLYPNTCI